MLPIYKSIDNEELTSKFQVKTIKKSEAWVQNNCLNLV